MNATAHDSRHLVAWRAAVSQQACTPLAKPHTLDASADLSGANCRRAAPSEIERIPSCAAGRQCKDTFARQPPIVAQVEATEMRAAESEGMDDRVANVTI